MRDAWRQGSSSYGQAKGASRRSSAKTSAPSGLVLPWTKSEEAALPPQRSNASPRRRDAQSSAAFLGEVLSAARALPRRTAREVAHRMALLERGDIKPLASSSRKRRRSKKGWSTNYKDNATAATMRNVRIGEESVRHLKRKVALAERQAGATGAGGSATRAAPLSSPLNIAASEEMVAPPPPVGGSVAAASDRIGTGPPRPPPAPHVAQGAKAHAMNPREAAELVLTLKSALRHIELAIVGGNPDVPVARRGVPDPRINRALLCATLARLERATRGETIDFNYDPAPHSSR